MNPGNGIPGSYGSSPYHFFTEAVAFHISTSQAQQTQLLYSGQGILLFCNRVRREHRVHAVVSQFMPENPKGGLAGPAPAERTDWCFPWDHGDKLDCARHGIRQLHCAGTRWTKAGIQVPSCRIGVQTCLMFPKVYKKSWSPNTHWLACQGPSWPCRQRC